MTKEIFLMTNIGSSSTKYAWYKVDGNKTKNITKKEANKDIASKTKLTVGIRVVAPGTYFQKHKLVTTAYIKKLKEVKELAPLHIIPVLKEIKQIKKHYPKAKIIACSDSAFHSTMPDVARKYAISTSVARKKDIYRFGYHGLAIQSAISILKQKKLFQKKVVICHLGGGSSVTAILNGRSIDTTMGFSPLEGIFGGARSGSIDITSISALKKSKREILDYLNHKSGFKGLTGVSNIQTILKKCRTKNNKNIKEKEAIELYIYQIQKAIGASIATLNGIDLLVFTGGVGENSKLIRKKVCGKFNFIKFKQATIQIDEMQEMLNICKLLR